MFKAFDKYLSAKIDLSESELESITSVTVEIEIRNLMRITLKQPCHTILCYLDERPATSKDAKDKINSSFCALFQLTRLDVLSYVADAIWAELTAIMVFEPGRGAGT